MSGSVSSTLSDDILLDLPIIVEQTGLSERTWRRIIASGQIGVVRISGSIRIPKSSLELYLTSCFSPPREETRPIPQDIGTMLDKVLPRRRGAR